MRKRAPLDYETIAAACAGEAMAVQKVVRYYSGYITTLAMHEVIEADGTRRHAVDHELKHQLESKLTVALGKFRIE